MQNSPLMWFFKNRVMETNGKIAETLLNPIDRLNYSFNLDSFAKEYHYEVERYFSDFSMDVFDRLEELEEISIGDVAELYVEYLIREYYKHDLELLIAMEKIK